MLKKQFNDYFFNEFKTILSQFNDFFKSEVHVKKYSLNCRAAKTCGNNIYVKKNEKEVWYFKLAEKFKTNEYYTSTDLYNLLNQELRFCSGKNLIFYLFLVFEKIATINKKTFFISSEYNDIKIKNDPIWFLNNIYLRIDIESGKVISPYELFKVHLKQSSENLKINFNKILNFFERNLDFNEALYCIEHLYYKQSFFYFAQSDYLMYVDFENQLYNQEYSYYDEIKQLIKNKELNNVPLLIHELKDIFEICDLRDDGNTYYYNKNNKVLTQAIYHREPVKFIEDGIYFCKNTLINTITGEVSYVNTHLNKIKKGLNVLKISPNKQIIFESEYEINLANVFWLEENKENIIIIKLEDIFTINDKKMDCGAFIYGKKLFLTNNRIYQDLCKKKDYKSMYKYYKNNADSFILSNKVLGLEAKL